MGVRLSPARWMVGGLLVVLLAACGGGDESATSTASELDTTAAAVPVQSQPAGQTPAADQPTPTGALAEAPTDTPTDAPVVAAVDPTTGEALAAEVNGMPIVMSAFERERARRTLGLEIPAANAVAFDAEILQSMIDQVLIAQAAERLGIVVTDAEIDAELSVQNDIVAQSGQTLDDVVLQQGYTMDEYRDVQHDMLLALKVSQVAADVNPMAAQVHSRHILVADEATARDLIARIQAGEDFAQLAAQYTLDGSTRPIGGDLDWVGEGDLLQIEVENVIFSLDPGQLYLEPVRSSLGYHVLQVLERVEDRPLTQAALAEKKQQAFLRWLDLQRQTAQIARYIGAGS